MKKDKVFITRRIPEEGIERLQKHYEVEVWPEEEPIPRERLMSKIQNVSGLVCMLSDKIGLAEKPPTPHKKREEWVNMV